MAKDNDEFQEFSADGERARVVMMGDGQLIVPYSLAFERQLSPLDVRVWMMMRAWYEHHHTISHEQLMQGLNVSLEAILDSLGMLDIFGWILLVPGRAPVLSAEKLTYARIIERNPSFTDNLTQYLEIGTPRMQAAAQAAIDAIRDQHAMEMSAQ